MYVCQQNAQKYFEFKIAFETAYGMLDHQERKCKVKIKDKKPAILHFNDKVVEANNRDTLLKDANKSPSYKRFFKYQYDVDFWTPPAVNIPGSRESNEDWDK